MAATITQNPPITAGAHIDVPVWAFLAMAAGMFLCYVALQENGLIMSSWMTIHEFFHDGRHALGVPCH